MGAVIALVAVLTVLLTGLSSGLVDSGISGLRAMPLDHLAFAPKTNSTFSQSTLDASTVDALGRQSGIQAEPLGLTLFNAKDRTGASFSIALVGVQPNGFMAKGVAGGSQLGSTASGVVISRGIASGGVHVGDNITLDRAGVSLRVVGVAPTATYGHVDLVYAPISLWRQATYGQVTGGALPPSARGLASAAALRVRPGVDVAAIGTTLGVDIVTKKQAYGGSPGYAAETATMSLIIDFLYVIAALIVGAFFTVWTVQRKPEIALMKALGAPTRYILRDALAQVVAVLVGATALGTAVGLALGSAMIGKAPFSLSAPAIAT
ncbi:MAG: ABC transporter permease, partial [Trebonia sp.]